MSFKKTRKAQLFTLDILLALVPLVIILGISANAFAGAVSQIQDYMLLYHTNRIVNNAADTLIKTSGIPENWNASYPSDGPEILGLARYTGYEEPYYLDADKIIALNNTISGKPLYEYAIPELLGDDNLRYFGLYFRGATSNTSNLSLSF